MGSENLRPGFNPDGSEAENLTINGTDKSDKLFGGYGHDTISGNAGDDTIDGQAGSDTIYGGEGNDNLTGNFGDDTLYGGAGNDTLTDDQGTNTLDGGDGDDNLTAKSLTGNQTLRGGSGRDYLNAAAKTVTLDGGTGNDSLYAQGRIYQANQWQYVQNGKATLIGGEGNDNLTAQSYSSAELFGGEGNDRLSTDESFDASVINTRLFGENGNDSLSARLSNGSWAQRSGSSYKDSRSAILSGGDGDDTLNTYIYYFQSDSGSFTANSDGGDGNDSIRINGSNALKGSININGGNGNDSIEVTNSGAGRASEKTTQDGFRKVVIDAGADDDTITVQGSLNTSITTGSGSDTIRLTAHQYRTQQQGKRNLYDINGKVNGSQNADPVTITDFTTGKSGDILDYSDLLKSASVNYNGENPFATGHIKLVQSGKDTLFQFDADGTGSSSQLLTLAVLTNTTASQLLTDNFNPNFPPDGSSAVGQVIQGTQNSDNLRGGFGNDTISGNAGDDTIDGQAGSDTIYGGEGNDNLTGNFGDDTLYGGAGNDTLTDDQGTNTLDGGDGDDNLTAKSLTGNQTLRGGSGRDYLNAAAKTVTLDGGTGNDSLYAQGRIYQANQWQYVQNGKATLIGGEGNDNLTAQSYSSAELFGGEGNDRLSTDESFDASVINTRLFGENGNDSLSARLSNGSWAQRSGSSYKDSRSAILSGGDGDDTLNTYIYYFQSDSGSFTANSDGGDGNDSIRINGSNALKGSININGGNGNDSIEVTNSGAGRASEKTTQDGFRKVVIDAGADDDTITVQGSLNTSITTGSGSDTIRLTAHQYRTQQQGKRNLYDINGKVNGSQNADPVTITDFTTGKSGDILDYSDLLKSASVNYNGENPFATGHIKLVQSGKDTLFQFDADGTGSSSQLLTLAVLTNTTASQLLTDNFNPNFPPDGSSAVGQVIQGTQNSDNLRGGFGNDTISGNAGDDTIDGQAGSDTIYGGEGNDNLTGNFGDDTLYGGAGNDTLTDDQGTNTLDGGDGDDNLTAKSLTGNQTLRGGSGRDYLNAAAKTVTLDGGTGNDSLYAQGRIYQANQWQYVQNGKATLIGGEGNDNLTAQSYSSAELFGGEGNDRLSTDESFDASVINTRLFGENGNDSLSARLSNGSWAQRSGSSYKDSRSAILSGGDGDDTLNTYIYYFQSDSGSFTANSDGGDGNDSIRINGSNALKGSININGGNGNDSIEVTNSGAGRASEKTTQDGFRKVVIDAGADDDTITVQGSLNTSITTGSGSDTIRLTAHQYRTQQQGKRNLYDINGKVNGSQNADPVTITDFTTGKSGDILDYSDLLKSASVNYNGENPFATGHIKLVQSGKDTLFQFDADGSGEDLEAVTMAILKGVDKRALEGNPFNGEAGATQLRLADADYSDGQNTPAGSNRKSAREISNIVSKQETTTRNARQLSDMVWAWGQFIDHDIVDTPGGRAEQLNIDLPADDPLLKQFPNAKHFSFTRSKGVIDDNGVRQQQNATTALIDASAVYGFTDDTANGLRIHKGGKLKVQQTGYGEVMPMLNGRQGPQFHAGDHRATENPLLSAVHTIWLREHNRLADEIAKKTPGLSDQQIFEKAKSQVTGLIQHITYNEFLPALLGAGSIKAYAGYDSSVDPGISTEFATAGFRVGHTLISDDLTKISKDGHTEAPIALKDSFFNVQHLLKGGLDAIINGASQVIAQEVDTQLVDGLRDFLFGRGARVDKDGSIPAMDLAARNIQRGRDHGIADYNSLRASVGLKKVSSFSEISSNKEVVAKLQKAYSSIDDVDAFVAGLAEDHVKGGSVGQLFSTIISNQFNAIRDGDQNWFEAKGGALSNSEIDAIKATSLAEVIKRNSGIEDLEANVFFVRDDVVEGTSGDDVISKGGGDDALYGKAGNDKLVGGLGNDKLYGEAGDDILSGGAGKDQLDGGEGNDIALFSGKLADYRISRVDASTLKVVDQRSGSVDGTDTLTSVELLRFSDKDLAAKDINTAPVLSGKQATLAKGKEDTAYIIKEDDLLQGFSDIDGDKLQIKDLNASTGLLKSNENSTWTYTPKANKNGTVKLEYTISDGRGGDIKTSNSFELEAVNDAPIVSGPVDLGVIDEDGSIRITKEQLLKNSSDVDGDVLSITDLKVTTYNAGALKENQDGSWNFFPTKDWNGSVSLEYNVSDRATKIPDQYLSLSGDYSEYAVIKYSDSLNISGEITISSWVLREDDGTDWRNVYDIPDAHMLEFSPSGGFDFRAENNDIDFNANGSEIPHKTWTHVAARMQKISDGSYDADVFVNGELVTNARRWQLNDFDNGTGVRSSGKDIYLGVLQSQVHWKNGDPFAGGIDDFQIWNKALSGDQIKKWLFNKETSQSATDLSNEKSTYQAASKDSLVGLYTFNSSDGLSVIDESGNSNHAKIVNATLETRGLIEETKQVKTSAEFVVNPVNDAPELTSTKADLADAYVKWNYTIQESDLIKGYSDIDGDTLKVKDLKASKGALKNLGNGSWQLTTPRNFQGEITLSYSVIDGNGAEINADQSFTVKQAVLEGSNQSESLSGDAKDEWVYAYNGFDTIRAAGGNDRAYGGYGNDTIYGGDGNDQLYGEQDDDILRGGAGDDELYGGYGNDNIKGGGGNDRLTGGEGADTLDGGNGSDTYFLDDERDTIKDTGTNGTDTVYYRYLSNKYELGEGIENVVLPGSATSSKLTVMGNSGNNDITSGDGDDTVMAGDGDDIVYTGSGNDKVEAGTGNDLIIGGDGAGDDSYDGGSGFDTIKYTSAIDDIFVDLDKGIAGSKNGGDKAGIGSDTLKDIESVIGGYYDDLLIGDGADNTFEAEKGDDIIIGGFGNDTAVYSGQLSDYIANANSDGTITITDKRTDSNDGTDSLNDVENLRFTDQTIALNDFLSVATAKTTIESKGGIRLLEDSSGLAYVEDSLGNTSNISYKNKHVGNSTWKGWSAIAADSNNGTNQVVWNRGSSYWISSHDANWKSSSGFYIKPESSAFTTLETQFGQDLNGDSIIASALSTIESNGDIRLLEDSSGLAYVEDSLGNTSNISYKNKHVGNSTWKGWSAIAADSNNGTNQVVWNRGSSYWISSHDANWKSSSGFYIKPESSAFTTLETQFGQDLNGDSIIASALSTIESNGDIRLLEDSSGLAYVEDSLGNTSNISYKNKHVGNSTWKGWSAIAADSNNGTNQVVWNRGSSYWISSHDANWKSSSGFYIKPESSAFTTLETQFGQDLNGDSIIGSALSTIESNGDIRLLEDSSGLAYVEDSLGNTSNISYKNKHVGNSTWKGWSAIAADSNNGTNQVVWNRGSSYWISSHDAKWKSSSGSHIKPESSAFTTLETQFGQDLNGDSIIGSALSTIESNGDIRLLEDSSGLAYVEDSLGNTSNISYKNKHVGNSTWKGWSAIAADSYNGTNQVVWNRGSSYWISSHDANWKSSSGFYIKPESSAFTTLETQFGQDLNGDSIIASNLNIF